MNNYASPGYCQEDALADCRVISYTACNNKARYRLTKTNGKTIDVCGTHLRQYVSRNPITRLIEKTYGDIVEILDLKTDNVIYKKK